MATACVIKYPCAGELREKITIEKRYSSGSFDEDNINGNIVFTVLTTQRAKVQTVNGSSRFRGVAITDLTTHVFTIRYRSSIMNLDAAGEYFIRMKGRLFRVVNNGITNVDEQNKVIKIQCNERGLATKEATSA